MSQRTPTLQLLPLLSLFLLSNSVQIVSAVPDNKIHIHSEQDFCLFLPLNDPTAISASESPGGAKSYCTLPQGGQGLVSRA